MKLSIRLSIFFAIIFMLNIYTSNSQSLQIISADTLVTGTSADGAQSVSVCKNISSSDKNIRLKIHVISMTQGHKYSICDLTQCWPETDVDLTTNVSFTLQPNATTGSYITLHLIPYDKVGVTKLSVRFFIDNNESDFAEYTATFNITAVGVEEDNTSTQLINLYPNPANGYINFDMSKYSNYNSGTIEIYNSLGTLEKSIALNSLTDKLTININDLSVGTYLLVVKSNGNKLVSQPFMIYR